MIPARTLLSAYQAGFFPMPNAHGAIQWYSPDPRGILPLDGLHLARRLVRVIRAGRFAVTINQAFDEVIRACASRGDAGDWINQEIVDSYSELHRLGFAHSVESWRGERLVGGLYGVSLRGAFFGESMFHRESNGSKVALWALTTRLRDRGFALLDVQWLTPHLARLGAIEVSRERYLSLLDGAMRLDCRFEERAH